MAVVKAVLLPVGLIVAAIGAAVLWRDGESHKPDVVAMKDPKGTVTVQRRFGSDVVLAIRPGAQPVGHRVAAQPKLTPLTREWHDAASWKPILERLKALPSRTAEESYVLAEILDRCRTKAQARPRDDRRQVMATLSDRDPDTPRRMAAFDRLSRDRCAGIEGVTITDAELKALYAAGAADPKGKARLVEKELVASVPAPGQRKPGQLPVITDPQLEALRGAVQSGDPYAVAIAARIFGSTLQDFSVRTGPNDVPVDLRAFQDAWVLAACDLGLPCNADHPRMLSACAYSGHCGAQDLREHLFFFEHSPQQSQRVNDYQALIGQAIRSGDWSAFNFHRGPIRQGYVAWHLVR